MNKASICSILAIMMCLGEFSFARRPANQVLDTSDDKEFTALEYPELQVVPRASERLAMESQAEKDQSVLVHWPIQLSALATINNGYGAKGKYPPSMNSEEQKGYDLTADAAILVGGGWLVGSILLAMSGPYSRGLEKVRAVKGRDRKWELARERMAEETLENQHRLTKTLTNIAVVSQLAVNLAVASQADSSHERTAAIASMMSIVPWLFPHRHVLAWEKHQEYKRKIYAPVSYINLMPDKKTGELISTYNLAWSF